MPTRSNCNNENEKSSKTANYCIEETGLKNLVSAFVFWQLVALHICSIWNVYFSCRRLYAYDLLGGLWRPQLPTSFILCRPQNSQHFILLRLCFCHNKAALSPLFFSAHLWLHAFHPCFTVSFCCFGKTPSRARQDIFIIKSDHCKNISGFSILIAHGFSQLVREGWYSNIRDGASNNAEYEMFLEFCLYTKRVTLK